MKPDDAMLNRGGAQRLPVKGVRAGQPYAQLDWVADEVPVALEFNGISHAVMLATPLDLHDFALGFSLSEGLLAHPGELYGVEAVAGEEGITLQLDVASAAFARLKERRRSMAGRTGCGLCGTDSLAQVLRPLPVLPAGAPLQPAAIARAMGELAALQTLNQATGGVHAAAWCNADGMVQVLREDVGRHNALDKLVGALFGGSVRSRGTPDALPYAPPDATPNITPEDRARGFIAVTSRASFEMVQKTALAGVPLLAAVSAPTTMAIRLADQAGLSLVGFARRQDLAAYTHPARLGL